MGGAQPVAAALDREEWPEVVGTIAGDDTVLVICTDARHATEVACAAEDDVGGMTKTIQTAVVGVTGYAGAELARLLLHHPRLKGSRRSSPGAWTPRTSRAAAFRLPKFIRNLADNNGTAN